MPVSSRVYNNYMGLTGRENNQANIISKEALNVPKGARFVA